jgi:cytoskeletal protein CcmA (bactofilin family)
MLKLKGLSSEDLNGFMDQGTEFQGELRFRDTFRVDGRVKGRIVSDNMLIVGETGSVEADIDCGVVSIRGSVTGRAGARVQGTLVSPRLVIEEGAFFQGDCDMGASAPAAGPVPAPRPLR